MNGGSHVDHDGKLLVAGLLVFMARGSGRIEQQEADTMIALLSEYCEISGAEALELLQMAINELAEQPAAGAPLAERARSLSDERKEDLAYLALRVIAADGKREAAEMAQFNRAVEVAGIDPGIVHRAFDRFFAETMPETGD
jgi:uncharacterized tellurite resistance protein B-like protein